MKYFNSRLNLTAEPAKLNPENYCVNIDGDLRLIHKSLIEGSSDWEEKPAVLFTTEDGVDITDGETVVYCVEHRNDYNIETLKSGDANLQVDGKWFSTRKAAVLYIAENKPLYSLADIRKAWETLDLWHDWSDFANELK